MSPSRRYAYFFLIAVLTGALALAAGCLSEPEDTSGDLTGPATPAALTYYTEDLPPYNYLENGTLQGIAVDLLEAITEQMGEKVPRDEVRLAPWTEGYTAALTQNATVLFTMARTPERETSFKWVGPISTDRYVLFAGRDRAIAVAGPDDLKNYRIGVIADDISIQQLLDLGVDRSRLVQETNVSAIIAGLESGEIDLWCYSETGGRHFAEEVTGNAYTYTVVFTLQDVDNYYAFSRDVPDETVRSFQQALDALKLETDATGISTYEQILGRYIPSIGFTHLKYLTEEWAPFNYEKEGRAAGISVEILEAVFSNIGVNRTGSDVRIVPLAEGLQAAQNDTGTVLFSLARTPEREPLYQWAGPFASARFVLFAPAARNIAIASPQDLDRYRIGVVEESVEKDFLLALGVNASGLVAGETPKDLLSMLEEDRIDLWATGELAGRHQMMQTGGDPDVYEIVYTLGESDLYYVFSKDVPATLVRTFRQALDTVRNQKDEQGVSEYERIIYRNLGVRCTGQTFSDEAVIALVDMTAAAIERDAADTFRRINAGEAPYRDPEDPALYAFVYDADLTMVAHADNIRLVGENFRGKTDVAGKAFRDEILKGALENGTGWAEYVYVSPVQQNLYYKTTYYRLTTGSDGNAYIVCSGNFKRCDA